MEDADHEEGRIPVGTVFAFGERCRSGPPRFPTRLTTYMFGATSRTCLSPRPRLGRWATLSARNSYDGDLVVPSWLAFVTRFEAAMVNPILSYRCVEFGGEASCGSRCQLARPLRRTARSAVAVMR